MSATNLINFEAYIGEALKDPEFLQEYLNEALKENDLVDLNEYQRRQGPPVVKITRR